MTPTKLCLIAWGIDDSGSYWRSHNVEEATAFAPLTKDTANLPETCVSLLHLHLLCGRQ